MDNHFKRLFTGMLTVTVALALVNASRAQERASRYILTPPAPQTPRINGARAFGVRPGHPFLFTIPATGKRPMTFAVEKLPAGLAVDKDTGRITGKVAQRGIYATTIVVQNELGVARREFRIVCGEQIALTPPMGWNSWNRWGASVDEAKVKASAKAMAESGLIQHGWTYVNIDDAWQGKRAGPLMAIQPDEKKFPDMKGLCDYVHGLGLKVGIYSTPMTGTYAGRTGGSAGERGKIGKIGKYSFAANDVRQWVVWEMDYLKYDWNPVDYASLEEMSVLLRNSGRDIVYSRSAHSEIDPRDLVRLCHAWRTTGDINRSWGSVKTIGFSQDLWGPFAGPGHWNDPDMLEIGNRGLTADEEYTHMSLWCLLAAPLLIGCDMSKMSEFVVSLFSNDEVLAVNQDPLGHQARRVVGNCAPRKMNEAELKWLDNVLRKKTAGFPWKFVGQDMPWRWGQSDWAVGEEKQVWAKEMEDGSKAVGFFNLGPEPADIAADWPTVGVDGRCAVRDLWRQKDVGDFEGSFTAKQVPSHGVLLVRVIPTSAGSATRLQPRGGGQ